MRRILKFQFDIIGYQKCKLPRIFKPLHVAEQEENKVTLWVEVIIGEPEIELTFLCFPTGGNIRQDAYTHLGTALMKSGEVWHLYARPYGDPS